MFLQGNLQAVFDALYTIGAIDPVLKSDWSEVTKEMADEPQLLNQVVTTVNSCGGDHEMLVQELRKMDTRSVHFVALEVAREFCEFQERAALH